MGAGVVSLSVAEGSAQYSGLYHPLVRGQQGWVNNTSGDSDDLVHYIVLGVCVCGWGEPPLTKGGGTQRLYCVVVCALCGG